MQKEGTSPMADRLVDRCKGKWKDIYRRLGVLDGKALEGRDAPCPLCGGKDRFRVTYKDDGAALFYCHGCGEKGGGVALVMLVTGSRFPAAAKLIEGVVGKSSVGADTVGVNTDSPRDPLKSWRDARPDVLGTSLDTYHRSRGIQLTSAEARWLRFHPALWHPPTQSKWPAQIALVRRFDGVELTCHQTFIDVDGSGKAPIEKPRLFPKGATTIGGAVWFSEPKPDEDFAVTEGIENLLSALRIFGAGAGCAALSTSGMRSLVLPPLPLARRVRIFADHDELGQGIAAATEAARRWRAEGRSVAVSCSSNVGEDANDVLIRRLGAAS
jgi:putative DNA primase/helicase